MLKFMRSKLVSVERKGPDTLRVRGVLDDDIYGFEIDMTIGLTGMEILSIKGKWNRWTTPDCPRAIPFLQEAVGFRIESQDFSQQVQKSISRKACRHYANLLSECCHTAREAAVLIRGEHGDEKGERVPEGESGDKAPGDAAAAVASSREVIWKGTSDRAETPRGNSERAFSGETILDLHVHTSPASPCSSADVDLLIREAKRVGLDGVCLTDHNHVWTRHEIEALSRKHAFLVLRGNEITTNQGDMITFGLEEEIQGIIKLEDLRRKVLQAGGFMIVAHPFRGFLLFGTGHLGMTPEKAMERPLFRSVDAVEVLNGKVTERENATASEVAAGLGLPVTGGSDAHEVSEVGLCATRFFCAITNEEQLLEALKTGNYSPMAFRKERGFA